MRFKQGDLIRIEVKEANYVFYVLVLDNGEPIEESQRKNGERYEAYYMDNIAKKFLGITEHSSPKAPIHYFPESEDSGEITYTVIETDD